MSRARVVELADLPLSPWTRWLRRLLRPWCRRFGHGELLDVHLGYGVRRRVCLRCARAVSVRPTPVRE